MAAGGSADDAVAEGPGQTGAAGVRADVDGLSGGGHPDFRLNEAGE